MLYLQKYLTNFQKLFFRWKKRKLAIVALEISSAQTFSFSKGNVTTFPTSQKCKNFNFSLYTVLAEMLYLQKYLTNFQKLFFRWKQEEAGYFGWKFQVQSAQTFWFSNSNVTTFPTSWKCKISIFGFTQSRQKCYISRSI